MLFVHANPPSLSISNRPASRWVVAGWITLILAIPVILAIFYLFPDLDRPFVVSASLYSSLIVGAIIFVGSAASAIIVAAYRSLDGRALMIGLGILGGSVIILVHVLFDASLPNPQPNLPIAGLVVVSIYILIGGFASPALSRDRRAWRYWTLWVTLVIAGAVWSFTSSDTLQRTLASTLGVSLVIVACSLALWRYVRLHRQSPVWRSFAFLAGLTMLGEAAMTHLLIDSMFDASFWLYHGAGITGMALITYALLRDWQDQSQRRLLQRLAFEQVRPLLSDTIGALVDALEQGEPISTDVRARLQQDIGLSIDQIAALERLVIAVEQEQRWREGAGSFDELLYRRERATVVLAQMVIHDLKNPLTALIGFLEMLSAGDLDESQRSLIESALRNGRDLAGLVDDLLDLIRYNEGRLRLRISEVSLPALCTESIAELAGWLTYESKTLILEVSPALPVIRTDARLLKRILLNLLSNAIKHTPYGTTITLRVWREPLPDGSEQTVIEVADTGPGIPPERIERIFEPFGATGESRSSRQSSTGVGLAFCKMAATALGGTIEVSSFPGDGATFRVRLPDR